ncbi:MAG TPA: deoxyribonuclease IV [Verrucomicrobiota bacterium]|nr:deoxyribonuclease IV [Verrucomicrobiota bacterium]
MKFGAHTSIAGGVFNALERGASIGCEVIQLFVKNNMQWFSRRYSESDINKYFENSKKYNFFSIFGHTGYLINIAAPDGETREKSIQSLQLEIELADSISLPFLVLHPGAHLGQGEQEGIQQAVKALNDVFKSTKNSRVKIAIECTAGQGTCLGYKLEHIAEIFFDVDDAKRLAVCLDTAHLFQAGYDITTPQGWENVIKKLDNLIGINNLLAIHLNDSKTPFGSRVDRHSGIGKGKMKLKTFKHIVNDPHLKDMPGCLETPKSPDLHEDIENLKILRSLVDKRT